MSRLSICFQTETIKLFHLSISIFNHNLFDLDVFSLLCHQLAVLRNDQGGQGMLELEAPNLARVRLAMEGLDGVVSGMDDHVGDYDVFLETPAEWAAHALDTINEYFQ